MLKVYVTVEGLEQIALGNRLWAWHYTVREAEEEASEHSILIGEFEPALPGREDCIAPVLERFRAKEAEIQAEAYRELQEVKSRRDNLLALTMEQPA